MVLQKFYSIENLFGPNNYISQSSIFLAEIADNDEEGSGYIELSFDANMYEMILLEVDLYAHKRQRFEKLYINFYIYNTPTVEYPYNLYGFNSFVITPNGNSIITNIKGSFDKKNNRCNLYISLAELYCSLCKIYLTSWRNHFFKKTRNSSALIKKGVSPIDNLESDFYIK